MVEIPERKEKFAILIFLSGFSATVIQVLLMHEIITVFQGNELLIGWTLGIWMMLTGLGTLFGGYFSQLKNIFSLPHFLIILLVIIPIINVVLLNFLKTEVFLPGIVIQPLYFLTVIVIFLFPVCFISGIIFSLFIVLFQQKKDGFITTYAYESFGSLIGGLMVSLIFIRWFGIIQSLIILAILVLFIIFLNYRKYSIFVILSLMIICLVISFFYPVEKYIKSQLFVNQNVIENKETFYENLIITENAGQFNFFANGTLLFSSDNTVTSEEYVHYVMLQHPLPKKILLISGGISGMLKEILKYPSVECIDYIEPNPQLVSLASKYTCIPVDKKIHLIFNDVRKYIRNTNEKYDIVILAIPDPSSLQIYRLYTTGFLNSLKRKLNPGAFILYGITPAGNYLGEEKTIIESSLYHSLKSVFKFVKIIPGERDFHIASDSSVSIKIGLLADKKKIENTYVNSNYMDDNSISERSEFIETRIKGHFLINNDEKPIVVFAHTLKFLSQFNNKKLITLLLPVLIFLIPVFFLKKGLFGMYISGMSASSIEIILIFIFQIIYGYLYVAIGIIIAIFMGGLAIGSLLSRKFEISVKIRSVTQVLLAISVLLIPVFWPLMNRSGTTIISLFLFFILNLVSSLLVGFQYGVYSRYMLMETKRSPILVYSADLLGSTFGVVAITVIIFPLAGIANTCYLLAGINFMIAAINFGKS